MPYKDPEKQKEYQRKWHLKTVDERRAKWRENNNKTRDKMRRFLKRVLMRNGCLICGYKTCVRSMHFHHVDPTIKSDEISGLFRKKVNIRIMKEEIRKCVILCANCHGEVHEGLINLEEYIRH